MSTLEVAAGEDSDLSAADLERVAPGPYPASVQAAGIHVGGPSTDGTSGAFYFIRLALGGYAQQYGFRGSALDKKLSRHNAAWHV